MLFSKRFREDLMSYAWSLGCEYINFLENTHLTGQITLRPFYIEKIFMDIKMAELYILQT
ncbi:hypothetical protein BHL53_14530 [Bacillus cereus]|nr:hypothetical protein BHL53_14530 [Bacillus cereus]